MVTAIIVKATESSSRRGLCRDEREISLRREQAG